jgi:3-methyladenine DNA glycosylase/8-oxoguanine DNA glycosylase
VPDQPALSVSFRFDYPPNLAQTLGHARMGTADPCLQVADGSVWRATRTPLGPATERVRIAGDGAVVVDAWGPGADWLLARAPSLCGALDDPSSFRPAQPLLRELTHCHPGLRIGRTDAVFETALLVTLEQRVATRDAWRSWRAMVRALGEPAPGPVADRLSVPPSAERIARTPYEVVQRFGVERRRADVLRRLAVVAHRLEETLDLPLEIAYRRFFAVSGVGPWTAARVGLIALGDPDAVALCDLHLPHLVSFALAGERRGSDERMLELLEPFRGHRGRVIRLLMAGVRSPDSARIALSRFDTVRR